MAIERLLERLQRWSNDDIREQSPAQQHAMLLCSVQKHLSELLSTHQGSALIEPTLGLPNNLELINVGNYPALATAIIDQIIRFEPRLANPSVEVLGVDHVQICMKFALSGQLGDDLRRIRFLISIKSGNASVLVNL